MKKIITLTESDLTRIVKRIISEQSEHVKNLYISWANKRSGNPEEALKLMDDVFKYQKKLSKKDFAQYSSYEDLRRDIVKIKSEERSTNATKIYEDGELLVLASNTYEASCKYGAGSKWCTTARDTDADWKRHNSTGTEFFWIFKNKPQDDPNHKFSYHVKIDGSNPDWCNAVNNCMSSRRLPEESYPKQHPKYNQIIEKLQEFHNARDMKNTNQMDDTRTIHYENERMVEELINENAMEIMRIFMDNQIDQIVSYGYDLSVDTYMGDEVYDNLPEYFEDLDEDEREQEEEDYMNDLEKHLESGGITFDVEMLNEMTLDLAYLVKSFLVDRYGFDEGQYFDEQIQEQDINIVDVIEKIIKDEEYTHRFNEIVDEVSNMATSSKVYYMAQEFTEKYKK